MNHITRQIAKALPDTYAAIGNEEDSIGTLIGSVRTKHKKHFSYLILKQMEKTDQSDYPRTTRHVKNTSKDLETEPYCILDKLHLRETGHNKDIEGHCFSIH